MGRKNKNKKNNNIQLDEEKIDNIDFDKIKYEIILNYCKEKYNEEKQREDGINSKAGFLLTIISLLIVGYTSLLTFFNNVSFKKIFLINFSFYIVIFLLFISLVLILFGVNFKKRYYLSTIDDLILYINKKNDKIKYFNIVINVYKETIKSYSKLNTKRVKLLSISIIVLLITIICSLLFSLYILGGIITI